MSRATPQAVVPLQQPGSTPSPSPAEQPSASPSPGDTLSPTPVAASDSPVPIEASAAGDHGGLVVPTVLAGLLALGTIGGVAVRSVRPF